MNIKHPLSNIGYFYEKEVAQCHLKNGLIVTFGGCVDIPNSYKDSGDLFDDIYILDGEEWKEGGAAPTKRASGSSVELIGAQDASLVLVVGGWGDGWGNQGSKESFLYDYNSGECQSLEPLPIRMKKPKLELKEKASVLASEAEHKLIWSFETQKWSALD